LDDVLVLLTVCQVPIDHQGTPFELNQAARGLPTRWFVVEHQEILGDALRSYPDSTVQGR
jgi:hypothetical protein